MEYRTLNLDSRWNICNGETTRLYIDHRTISSPLSFQSVGAALHGMFDSHRWTLLPDEATLNRFYNALDGEMHAARERFPVLEACGLNFFLCSRLTFIYRILQKVTSTPFYLSTRL
jgi:hypothetical protein